MLQVSSQDVFAPGAVGPGAEEGADPLLLTHPAGAGTLPPLPPLRPRTVPVGTAGSHTVLASIWTQIRTLKNVAYTRGVVEFGYVCLNSLS